MTRKRNWEHLNTANKYKAKRYLELIEWTIDNYAMKPKMNSRFLYLPFNQVELSWPKMTVSWQFTTHYMGCAKKRPQNGRTNSTTYENNPLCCLDIYSLLAIILSDTRGWYHQCFMSSFYARRSQKRKMTVMTWLSFCSFGIYLLKSCRPQAAGIYCISLLHNILTHICLPKTEGKSV